MAKKIKVELDFDHEQIVYLKTDIEQIPRMIVEIILQPNGTAKYKVAAGIERTTHYACELSEDRKLIDEKDED